MMVSSYQPPVMMPDQPPRGGWGGWGGWGGNLVGRKGGLLPRVVTAPTAPRGGYLANVLSARPPRRGAGHMVMGRLL
jgi:hypothetical protein